MQYFLIKSDVLLSPRVGSASDSESIFHSSTEQRVYSYWRWVTEMQEYYSRCWREWCQEISFLCSGRMWTTELLIHLPTSHWHRLVATGCQGSVPKCPLLHGFGPHWVWVMTVTSHPGGDSFLTPRGPPQPTREWAKLEGILSWWKRMSRVHLCAPVVPTYWNDWGRRIDLCPHNLSTRLVKGIDCNFLPQWRAPLTGIIQMGSLSIKPACPEDFHIACYVTLPAAIHFGLTHD